MVWPNRRAARPFHPLHDDAYQLLRGLHAKRPLLSAKKQAQRRDLQGNTKGPFALFSALSAYQACSF